jgi:hypothetical protein
MPVILPLPSAVMLPASDRSPCALLPVRLKAYAPLRLAWLKFLLVTFNRVDALADPEATWIVTTPNATPLTLPALTVANDVLAEFQVAVELMSVCVPSLRVAIALSSKVCPTLTAEFCGDKAMDLTVADDVEFELELLTSPQPTRHIASTSVTVTHGFLNSILFTFGSPVHSGSFLNVTSAR